MEGASVAQGLPELYRAVLERVASLEHTGRRDEALIIRRQAVAAYSKAWDETAHKRLDALRERAERVLDGIDRPRLAKTPRAVLRWSRSA